MSRTARPDGPETRSRHPSSPRSAWARARRSGSSRAPRRTALRDRQIVRQAGWVVLDAVLFGAGRRDGYAVTGQILDADRRPVRNVEVTLHVDGKPARTVRTDGFGEFEFALHRGDRLGVCVGAAEAVHVELWSREQER